MSKKSRIKLQSPITYRNLSVDFAKRTVTWKGQIIRVDDVDVIVLPILSTDQLVVPYDHARWYLSGEGE